MTWTTRTDTRRGDTAHGITFVMFERRAPNVRAEAAIGQEKIHADGTGALTLALDQWKYGDELVAQLFTVADVHRAPRRADGWTRIQIFLGPANLETAQALDDLAQVIRERQARP